MDATQGASPRLPINFFLKEVAQNQATLLPRQHLFLAARNRFRSNFRGWRLDEFSIFARPSGKVYPHEIGIHEPRANHRKLDSQATLSHRARGRAVDGLRTQAWPLRASRLAAYRHGLRASEVCDLQWQQIELSKGRRVASGEPQPTPRDRPFST